VTTMKRIEAVIRPERENAVKNALAEAGYVGLTAYEVRGRGRQKGQVLQYRGISEYIIDMLQRTKVELLVRDQDVKRVVSIITEQARTGNVGDGLIYITPVEDAIRVRTGERGDEAL